MASVTNGIGKVVRYFKRRNLTRCLYHLGVIISVYYLAIRIARFPGIKKISKSMSAAIFNDDPLQPCSHRGSVEQTWKSRLPTGHGEPCWPTGTKTNQNAHIDALLKLVQVTKEQYKTTEVQILKDDITVISVSCEGSDPLMSQRQRRQLAVLIKTIVMLAQKHVSFHLISDSKVTFMYAQTFIDSWSLSHQQKFSLITHDMWYPPALEDMKTTFRPCSSQRLFLPSMFLNVSKAIYLDTDLIFLRPIDHLWNLLETHINSSMYGGFAPRMVNVKDKRLPQFGKMEVNAGLFLMNLEQLRQYPGGWENRVTEVYQSNELSKILGTKPDDQDILNVLVNRHPEKYYNISCDWNYRFFMCENPVADRCEEAQRHGISVLHGLGHTFMNCTKSPTFCKIFQVAEDYKLSTQTKTHLHDSIKSSLESIRRLYRKGYRCKRSLFFNDMVLKRFRNYL